MSSKVERDSKARALEAFTHALLTMALSLTYYGSTYYGST